MDQFSNAKGTVILGAVMLEESGYSVINRSCQNPVAELMAEAPDHQPVVAYVVCNQNGHALEDLRNLRSHKPAGAPVVLGGHYTLGCHNKIRQQNQLRAIGIDHFVETLEELLPLLDHLARDAREEQKHQFFDTAVQIWGRPLGVKAVDDERSRRFVKAGLILSDVASEVL
jgi:methylmalonyl-CoA mutase cobalamin-binding subunit